MPLTPTQRVLAARKAAHALHAKYDSREITKKAQQGFLARFEREVDPDGVLPIEERQRRAHQAMKSYMTGLALKSSRAAQARKQKQKPPDELDLHIADQ